MENLHGYYGRTEFREIKMVVSQITIACREDDSSHYECYTYRKTSNIRRTKPKTEMYLFSACLCAIYCIQALSGE